MRLSLPTTMTSASESGPSPARGTPAAPPAPAPMPVAPTVAQGAPAPAAPQRSARTAAPDRVDALPPWRVLLHNDDENNLEFVIMALIQLASMKLEAATKVVSEAHHTGVALICATHRERAELFQEQFTSKGLTVTIEPGR